MICANLVRQDNRWWLQVNTWLSSYNFTHPTTSCDFCLWPAAYSKGSHAHRACQYIFKMASSEQLIITPHIWHIPRRPVTSVYDLQPTQRVPTHISCMSIYACTYSFDLADNTGCNMTAHTNNINHHIIDLSLNYMCVYCMESRLYDVIALHCKSKTHEYII
jgi:hypothetical protein